MSKKELYIEKGSLDWFIIKKVLSIYFSFLSCTIIEPSSFCSFTQYNNRVSPDFLIIDRRSYKILEIVRTQSYLRFMYHTRTDKLTIENAWTPYKLTTPDWEWKCNTTHLERIATALKPLLKQVFNRNLTNHTEEHYGKSIYNQ